jgi:hypothetical protein
MVASDQLIDSLVLPFTQRLLAVGLDDFRHGNASSLCRLQRRKAAGKLLHGD